MYLKAIIIILIETALNAKLIKLLKNTSYCAKGMEKMMSHYPHPLPDVASLVGGLNLLH